MVEDTSIPTMAFLVEGTSPPTPYLEVPVLSPRYFGRVSPHAGTDYSANMIASN